MPAANCEPIEPGRGVTGATRCSTSISSRPTASSTIASCPPSPTQGPVAIMSSPPWTPLNSSSIDAREPNELGHDVRRPTRSTTTCSLSATRCGTPPSGLPIPVGGRTAIDEKSRPRRTS